VDGGIFLRGVPIMHGSSRVQQCWNRSKGCGAPKPLNFRDFGPFAALPMESVSPNHSGKERIYSSKLSWLGCGMG
jgi:hypothetical protein